MIAVMEPLEQAPPTTEDLPVHNVYPKVGRDQKTLCEIASRIGNHSYVNDTDKKLLHVFSVFGIC